MKTITKILNRSGYVVTSKNIEELVQRVYSECDSKDKIEITLYENSAKIYNYDDIEFIKENLLKKSRITNLEIWLFKHILDDIETINVKLEHGGYFRLYIKGKEPWVNSIYQSIEDLISNWKPQFSWINKYDSFFFFIIFLIFFIGLGFLFGQIKWHFNIKLTIIPFILCLLLLFCFSMSVSGFITGKLIELFPPIEFITGPDHLQNEKRRKHKLWLIFTIVISPFIITVIGIIIGVLIA